ncbi:MAG: hypothetical protein GY720_20180 [bacterium]|nr:hypothetical protein [bacterium]
MKPRNVRIRLQLLRALTFGLICVLALVSCSAGVLGWGGYVRNECAGPVEVWFVDIGAGDVSADDDAVWHRRTLDPQERTGATALLNEPGWDIIVVGSNARIELRIPPGGEELTDDEREIELAVEGDLCNS